MSWAYGVIDGREVGYSVAAECDHPECRAEIDRGLSHYCGNIPGDTLGCGGFFCSKHLEFGPDARPDDDFPRQLCAACVKEWESILGTEAYHDSELKRAEEG